LRKELKGNLGLFLVCAEITKRNLIALPTSRNTKGIDLIILDDETNRSVGLQVKCSDRNEYPVINSYWDNYKKEIQRKIISPFVFVDISDISNINNPKYFILSREETINVLTEVIEQYIARYLQKKNQTRDEVIRERKKAGKKKDVWVIKQELIKKYEGKWDTVLNILKKKSLTSGCT